MLLVIKMVSKEEVIVLALYLFLVTVVFIIAELVIGVKLPRDFIARVLETVNVTQDG